MKHFLWISVAVTAGFLLISGTHMQGQGGGQGRGQRGGFGGQMGQPVQGTVTEATASKLTIKTDAGDSYEVTITDTARVMRAGEPIKLSDVKPGDSVTVRGTVDASKKTVQAMMVMDVDAATAAKAKENLGKTYITGRVTAIDADNLKITVTRTDGVSQVIAVDEGTSFQRGNRGVTADVAAAGGEGMGMGMRAGRQGAGAQATPPAPESITLADIKVGDALMATGSVKGGAFTVLKMGVSEPGMGPGAGRNRGAQGQAAPAGAGTPPAAPPQ